MNASLGILESELNWRQKSVSKEIYTSLPLLLPVFFCFCFCFRTAFVCLWLRHGAVVPAAIFSARMYVWPGGCSSQRGELGQGKGSWGLSSRKPRSQWEADSAGFLESQAWWPGLAHSHLSPTAHCHWPVTTLVIKHLLSDVQGEDSSLPQALGHLSLRVFRWV